MPLYRLVRTILFVTLAIGIAGCTTAPRTPTATEFERDASISPAENLARLASAESSIESAPTSQPIALPPGVEPEVLSLRSADHSHARLSLAEAISKLAADASWEQRLALPEARDAVEGLAAPDAETEKTALEHYVRGREAALNGRYLAAATEFEKAYQLDPGSPAVVREFARSLIANGNQGRATELYVRLLALEPNDSEALFTLALAAANRREFSMAASILAQRHNDGLSFPHDPAAGLLAYFTLSASLRQLEYDFASIEAGLPATEVEPQWIDQSMYSQRVGSVYRQRSEMWRHIGDAWCRLGEFEQALDAYGESAALPATDPAALHPRVIYSNLQLARQYTAQHELLQALTGTAPEISDRDVRLCGYVAENTSNTQILAEAVNALYRESPNSSSLVRCAAMLLPSARARSLLREYVDLQPRDEQVVADLFAWLSERDPSGAIDLAASLIADHPDLAGTYARRLLFAVPEPSLLLRESARYVDSPAGLHLHARLLAMLGAEGQAWSIATSGRSRWPENPGLLWLTIDLAAVLEEPLLINELAGAAEAFDDATTALMLSRAHRSLGQSERAVEAAELGMTHAEKAVNNDDVLTAARLELARAYMLYASRFEDEQSRQTWAAESGSLAEAVLRANPTSEDAHEMLLSLFGPNGLLSDPERFRQVARHLYDNAPESRLYMRIAAEEAINQGRFDQAIERLLNLYDSNPADVNALELLITAWARQERLDAAEDWLVQRRSTRPHDPALLEQQINVLLARERADEAVTLLREARDAETAHPHIDRLLERVYRATDQPELALSLAETRLLSRPAGWRRELELAALYDGADREHDAFERLQSLERHLDHATFDNLTTAIALLGRLESLGDERDKLTLRLVEFTVERHPASPLQVYAAGLRSLGRLGRLDDAFDALARRAALQARGASEPTPQGALYWRDFTQAFIDDGHAAAAARALRTRILIDQPLQPQALALLATFTIVADAVSEPAETRAERTISLLEELAQRDRLPQLLGMESEPTLTEALFHASRIYSILDDDASVEPILRRVVELQPDHATALNNLGYMRLEQGRGDAQTVQWIERAFELTPEESNVQDTLGWLRYKQGRFLDDEAGEGALTLIERSRTNSPEPSAEVLDHLADVHWRLANHDEAVSLWREALALLEDSSYRRELEQNFQLLQTRGWGLSVMEPSAIFENLFGAQRHSLRTKLDAIENGDEPPVTPTFTETESGETGD